MKRLEHLGYNFLRVGTIIVAIAVIGLGTICGTHAASFQGLGYLTEVNPYSEARAVSADGSVVVGYSYSSSGREIKAFRWTESYGLMSLTGFPGGIIKGGAYGISADGSVVVGYATSSSSGAEAFRWTESGGMQNLGFPEGNFDNAAYGISADGSVIVGTSSPSVTSTEAFRWTESEGIVGIGDLLGGGFHSTAQGISGDGSTIVGYSSASSGYGTEAFRWTESDGMVGLGSLIENNFDSEACDVSADGSVVVGYSNGEAFRWTESDGMVGLGRLPGNLNSFAYGVSADGLIVVGQCFSTDGYVAFIWDGTNRMRNLKDVLMNDYDLDLAGWDLYRAYAISDDGSTIVGIGRSPSGNGEAWRAVLDPVPEPSGLLALGGGLLGLVGYVRRRRA